MATRCSICRAPDPMRCLALLGEPLSQILLPAELHLVRRASSENRARDLLVVLTDGCLLRLLLLIHTGKPPALPGRLSEV